MKCLVILRKDSKGFYKSSIAYRYLKCRCDNCKKWKKQDNKKYKKPQKEYNKEYYTKNKEKILKKQKKYYNINKESVRQYQSKYFKTENGKTANRSGARKRRARKYQNLYIPYKEKDVLEKYGVVCYLCNKSIDLSISRKIGSPGWQQGLHIEHVFDIALGGEDTIDNVRPSHAICNLTKSPRPTIN